MRFISPTIVGIEDLAAEEISRLGGKIERIEKGIVIYSGPEELFTRVNYFGKMVERVAIIIGEGEIEKESDLVKVIRCDVCEGKKINVKIEMKNAKFRKKELEIEARKLGNGEKEISLFLWLNGEKIIGAIDTTGEGLHHRGYRVFKHPASLNPILAAAMLKISGWKNEFVDPFCGSGTILIEGYHQFKGIGNRFRKFQNWEKYREIQEKMNKEEPEILGVEKEKRYVEGAKLNAKKAEAKVKIIRGDARFLSKYYSGKQIITNPPFGLRMGNKKNVFSLYENFAKEMEENFEGSYLTMIIPHTKFENYFKIEEKREIKYGKLQGYIYKFKI